MKLSRRRFLHLTAGAAALPAVSRFAWAGSYPTRPVHLIVGFPPGGPTDIFARLIGDWLSKRFGQPFVIENRPGAASYYQNLSFNLVRDIAPVCGVALEPMVMVVNPSVPARTVPEFIANAKAEPGKIVMASVGNGTTPQMAGELFKMMADVDLLHVPYQGAAPALTDLLGGRAQVMFEAMPTLVGYIKSGKLRALAVTTAARSPVFPDLPTIGEFLPGYDASVWFGVAARKQTPADIVELLNKEINVGLADPALSARLGDVGGTPLTGSSADFEKLFVGDSEKWTKVMRTANIKPE
jgi:tripartite-type tricarboxylate transporter receptor subunit TctC